MKPYSVGRILGIGARVAGRMAGQRARKGASAASADAKTAPAGKSTALEAGRAAGELSRGVVRGTGGFFRPFLRIGRILWLEVTGAFFLLIALGMGPALWRTRASYAAGPEHRSFLAAAGICVIFLYLGISSFWRARRR